MPLLTQVIAIITCLGILGYIIHLVKHDKLMLRYSLLWIAFAVVLLVCAIFPNPLFSIGHLLGFETSSNFIFFVGFIFLLAIVLTLSSIVSKQFVAIKNLTQKIALLEKELLDR